MTLSPRLQAHVDKYNEELTAYDLLDAFEEVWYGALQRSRPPPPSLPEKERGSLDQEAIWDIPYEEDHNFLSIIGEHAPQDIPSRYDRIEGFADPLVEGSW